MLCDASKRPESHCTITESERPKSTDPSIDHQIKPPNPSLMVPQEKRLEGLSRLVPHAERYAQVTFVTTRNSWAMISQSANVAGCILRPELGRRVNQCAFHEAALESSVIMHARGQAMMTSSSRKSPGRSLQYVVQAVINPRAFSPEVPSNSGLGALMVDRVLIQYWRMTLWAFASIAQYKSRACI